MSVDKMKFFAFDVSMELLRLAATAGAEINAENLENMYTRLIELQQDVESSSDGLKQKALRDTLGLARLNAENGVVMNHQVFHDIYQKIIELKIDIGGPVPARLDKIPLWSD